MSTSTRTTRRRMASVSAATVLAVAAVTATVAGPDAAAGVKPILVEPLAAPAAFPDDVDVTFRRKLPGEPREVIRSADAGDVVVARLTLQPGAAFPWHTHPGPVVVSVTSGRLVYQQASDCVERDYAGGQAFLDPGNRVHTAWNPAGEPTVLVATFYGVGDDGKVTLPTADQSDRCP